MAGEAADSGNSADAPVSIWFGRGYLDRVSAPTGETTFRELKPGDRAIPIVSTDNETIERSRESPGAFAEVFDRHARTVHRYAARRLDAGVADDVMSETFLVAFERRTAFDGSANALPWLLGIATNLIKKHARLEARACKGNFQC